MTDWYNSFLMMTIFQLPLESIAILLLDAHPASALDHVWSTLWQNVYRIGNTSVFSEHVHIGDLIWVMQSHNSPLNVVQQHKIPLIEEFRQFFLYRHGFKREAEDSSESQLDCRNITILFVWRRNYVAHPRNPSGRLRRRIANEFELLQTVKSHFPEYRVLGEQLDR